MVHELRYLDPLVPVLFKTTSDDFFEVIGPLLVNGRCRPVHVENGIEHASFADSAKRHFTLTTCKLVGKAAEGPDIDLFAVHDSLGDLGREESSCALERLAVLLLFAEDNGKAHVGELDVTGLAMQNVLRLDVPVQNVLIVKGLEAKCHLVHRVFAEVLVVATWQISQVAGFEELEEHPNLLSPLEDLLAVDDVRTPQHLAQTALVEERLSILITIVKLLEREELTIRFASYLEDVSKTTGSYLLYRLVEIKRGVLLANLDLLIHQTFNLFLGPQTSEHLGLTENALQDIVRMLPLVIRLELVLNVLEVVASKTAFWRGDPLLSNMFSLRNKLHLKII